MLYAETDKERKLHAQIAAALKNRGLKVSMRKGSLDQADGVHLGSILSVRHDVPRYVRFTGAYSDHLDRYPLRVIVHGYRRGARTKQFPDRKDGHNFDAIADAIAARIEVSKEADRRMDERSRLARSASTVVQRLLKSHPFAKGDHEDDVNSIEQRPLVRLEADGPTVRLTIENIDVGHFDQVLHQLRGFAEEAIQSYKSKSAAEKDKPHA